MSLVLLTDFDGTMAEVDIGDTVMTALADSDLVQRVGCGLQADEYGSRVGQTALWSTLAGREAEVLAVADEAPLDPAAPELFRLCRERGIRTAILSDGMAFYIRRVLDRHGLTGITVYANEAHFSLAKTHVTMPHGNPRCDWCACCKASVVRRYQADGSRVLYVGDGYSDRWAAACADLVLAKGVLQRYLADLGRPFHPISSLVDVVRFIRELKELPEGERIADSRCRF